jgi:hypothetical protein
MTETMEAVAARRLRLANQGLAPAMPAMIGDPVAVVRHLTAMQGQDLPAVLRAIALRAGTDIGTVRAAFDSGELVRGWPMRGTLFAITPRDLRILLSLTGAKLLRAAGRRRAQLDLNETLIARAGDAADALLASAPASRSELLAAFTAAGLPVDQQRGYHLIWSLSQAGRLWWGPFRGAEQLAVAADPSLHPEDQGRTPAELIGELLRRYLLGHAPATLEDFVWWTKLTKGEVRAGLATIADEVETVEIDGREHLLPAGWRDTVVVDAPGVVLVPGFDEWVLGYADRSLIASPDTFSRLVPGLNGIFKAAVLVDGRVVGTFKRATGKAGGIEVDMIEQVNARTAARISRAAAQWEHD